MQPPGIAQDISMNAGNMILNRFCIDEDAAFELSGVNYLKKRDYSEQRIEKGKEYSFLWYSFLYWKT